MNFNPNPSKQAQEVILSRKSKKISHPLSFFNNIKVSQFPSQKHLGIILDEQLRLSKHLKMMASKINKTIGLLQKM